MNDGTTVTFVLSQKSLQWPNSVLFCHCHYLLTIFYDKGTRAKLCGKMTSKYDFKIRKSPASKI